MYPDELVWDFNTQAYRLPAPDPTDVEQAVRNALGLPSRSVFTQVTIDSNGFRTYDNAFLDIDADLPF